MFYVVDENPNCVTGGCGDVDTVIGTADCHGPYVVFPGTDMENIASPHTVICAAHLKQAYDAVFGGGERLAGGEATGHQPAASPVEETGASRRESDVFGDDLVDFSEE